MSDVVLFWAQKVAAHVLRHQDVFEYDELVSLCWLAGQRMFAKYNPASGKPSTFFVPRMRGAILDAIRLQHGKAGSGRRTALHPVELQDFHWVTPSPEDTLLDRVTLQQGIARLTPAKRQHITDLLTERPPRTGASRVLRAQAKQRLRAILTP